MRITASPVASSDVATIKNPSTMNWVTDQAAIRRAFTIPLAENCIGSRLCSPKPSVIRESDRATQQGDFRPFVVAEFLIGLLLGGKQIVRKNEMEARWGRLLYWTATTVAALIVVWVIWSYVYNIEKGFPVFPILLLLFAAVIWLAGLACRYVLARR